MAKQSREEYLEERAQRVEQLTEAMADRVSVIATGEHRSWWRRRAVPVASRNAMLVISSGGALSGPGGPGTCPGGWA